MRASRKPHIFCWGVAEFGPVLLSREDLWFTLGHMLSANTEAVSGGLSAVTNRIFNDLFFSASGTNFAETGIRIGFSDGSVSEPILAELLSIFGDYKELCAS